MQLIARAFMFLNAALIGIAADPEYIVTLKRGASKSSILAPLRGNRATIAVSHEWDHALNGFSAQLDTSTLNALRNHPQVESVIPDGKLYAFATTTQTNAPWGLARLSSKTRLTNPSDTTLTHNYTYDSSGGSGVDIYVLDTGIRITHNEFGGRARWGATIGPYQDVDGHGHGTHCAGTAAGRTYGVAKAANLIAVRVLSDLGSASTSSVISGIDYIKQASAAAGRPSVVLIALGGSANAALDAAVVSLLNAGIHVVVAAGGSNTNTEATSPARVPGVITVGACTISDARSSFSNYGPGIDVYAPGMNILSAWNTSDNATNTLSGTSMAAAHVAGLVAYLIGLEGNISTSAMEAKLKSYALLNILTGIPSGTNYLAQNKA